MRSRWSVDQLSKRNILEQRLDEERRAKKQVCHQLDTCIDELSKQSPSLFVCCFFSHAYFHHCEGFEQDLAKSSL